MKRTLNYFLCVLAILTLTRCKKQAIVDQSVKQPVPKTVKTLDITSYPSYNTSPLPSDQTGVSSTAAQLAAIFQFARFQIRSIELGNSALVKASVCGSLSDGWRDDTLFFVRWIRDSVYMDSLLMEA
jgi:hypothetical protein